MIFKEPHKKKKKKKKEGDLINGLTLRTSAGPSLHCESLRQRRSTLFFLNPLFVVCNSRMWVCKKKCLSYCGVCVLLLGGASVKKGTKWKPEVCNNNNNKRPRPSGKGGPVQAQYIHLNNNHVCALR